MKRKFILVLLIISYQFLSSSERKLGLMIFSPSAWAQTMTNDQFKLKMGNFNSISGQSSGPSYKLNETSGGDLYGLYSGTNYKVKAGFQYVRVKIPFSFTISQNLIDFGILTATNPVTRATNLTVNSESAKSFTVIASENKPLTSSNATIPDTSCDLGNCNSSTAAPWAGTLTYGFGYRCDDVSGTNCASGFLTDLGAAASSAYFKPFSISPTNQTIMSSTKGGRGRKSQISYKVNVSASQPTGTYTNVVTYIASPGF